MIVHQDGREFYNESGAVVFVASVPMGGDYDMAGAIAARNQFEIWAQNRRVPVSYEV